MSIETVKACVKRIAALFPLNIGREPKYGLAIKGAGYGRKARFQNGIFYTCPGYSKSVLNTNYPRVIRERKFRVIDGVAHVCWERRYSEENTQVKIAY